MLNLYRQLYADCCNLPGFKTESHFVSMHGEHYMQNSRRFLLIGRSTNGWDSLNANSAESFGAEAEKQFNDVTRWDWVESVNGTIYSRYYKSKEKPSKRYCLDKKPYWAYSKAIFEQLPDTVKDAEIWMQNIAWTNLYKISPKNPDNINNNPDSKFMKIQLNTCIEILKEELEYFNPTHILIMSGFEWFKSFSSIFTDVVDSGQRNICRGKNKNNIFLEGRAKYKKAPVAISCRPEWRDKEGFVSSVLSALK